MASIRGTWRAQYELVKICIFTGIFRAFAMMLSFEAMLTWHKAVISCQSDSLGAGRSCRAANQIYDNSLDCPERFTPWEKKQNILFEVRLQPSNIEKTIMGDVGYNIHKQQKYVKEKSLSPSF